VYWISARARYKAGSYGSNGVYWISLYIICCKQQASKYHWILKNKTEGKNRCRDCQVDHKKTIFNRVTKTLYLKAKCAGDTLPPCKKLDNIIEMGSTYVNKDTALFGVDEYKAYQK